MGLRRGKKRKTDAETAYLRSEIKTMKQMWAEIKGPDQGDAQEPGASGQTGTQKQNRNTYFNNETSAENEATSSDSTSSSEDDEGLSQEVPTPFDFSDDFFESQDDNEEPSEPFEPKSKGFNKDNEDSFETFESNCEGLSVEPASKPATQRNPKGPIFPEGLLEASGNVISTNNCPIDSSTKYEVPEVMRDTDEVSREFLETSADLSFNPLVCSSPLCHSVKKYYGYDSDTTGSNKNMSTSLMTSEDVFNRISHTGLSESNTPSSAIEFSEYPTPTTIEKGRAQEPLDQPSLSMPVETSYEAFPDDDSEEPGESKGLMFTIEFAKPSISEASSDSENHRTGLMFTVEPAKTSLGLESGAINREKVREIIKPAKVPKERRRNRPIAVITAVPKAKPTISGDGDASSGPMTRSRTSIEIPIKKAEISEKEKPELVIGNGAQSKVKRDKNDRKSTPGSSNIKSRSKISSPEHDLDYYLLRITKNKNGKLECPLCPKGVSRDFGYKNTIKRHLLTVHFGLSTSVCKFCGNKFKNSNQLANHLATHDEKYKFSCRFCQVGFTRKASMDEHIRTVHKTPFRLQCKFCERSYTYKTTLLKHIRDVHPGNV